MADLRAWLRQFNIVYIYSHTLFYIHLRFFPLFLMPFFYAFFYAFFTPSLRLLYRFLSGFVTACVWMAQLRALLLFFDIVYIFSWGSVTVCLMPFLRFFYALYTPLKPLVCVCLADLQASWRLFDTDYIFCYAFCLVFFLYLWTIFSRPFYTFLNGERKHRRAAKHELRNKYNKSLVTLKHIDR
jgi:hypothetical protein